jgi:hypothetical protein
MYVRLHVSLYKGLSLALNIYIYISEYVHVCSLLLSLSISPMQPHLFFSLLISLASWFLPRSQITFTWYKTESNQRKVALILCVVYLLGSFILGSSTNFIDNRWVRVPSQSLHPSTTFHILALLPCVCARTVPSLAGLSSVCSSEATTVCQSRKQSSRSRLVVERILGESWRPHMRRERMRVTPGVDGRGLCVCVCVDVCVCM